MTDCNAQNIYLYDELTDAEKQSVDDHVASCKSCRQLLEQVNTTKLVVRTAAQQKPEPRNAARLTSSIMTAVTREAASSRNPIVRAFDQVYLRYGMAAVSIGLLVLFVVEQQMPTRHPVERLYQGKTVALAMPPLGHVVQQRKQRSISLYACAQSASCNQPLIASIKSKRVTWN
jgi:predicted anti-sigma-YlaC factor YlaD